MTARIPEIRLEWLPGRFAVCRLDPSADVPEWARLGDDGEGLVSITRTDRELSIVASQSRVPPEVLHEPGWVALRVAGRLDFDLVGILAGLVRPLADAGVSVFALSTYDTDVILIQEDQADWALDALRTVCAVPS